MIRHTSVGVPKGVCYGQSDVPVSETFEEEAAAVRECLSKCKPFDVAYSSPLSRATKLAVACGYPSPITDERLKEMSMGEWELRAFDTIEDPELQAWYDDYMHLPTKGGESFPMLYARVTAFLDELRAKDYERVVIFAHGGVLMSAAVYGGLCTMDDVHDQLVPYGGMITIQLSAPLHQ